MGMQAENGTFGHLLVGQIEDAGVSERKPCPVCCELFSRDRDLVLTLTEAGKFYVCASASSAGDACDCGFAVPDNFSSQQIRWLAKQREQYLRSLKILGAIGGER
ncbi:MAG: hypothetical protein Q8M83_02350 [bacterium]|nr:hypothetical protein [bacterium]